MSEKDREFVVRLKALCDRFDVDQGRYPEHEYEGAALFEWVIKELAADRASWRAGRKQRG